MRERETAAKAGPTSLTSPRIKRPQVLALHRGRGQHVDQAEDGGRHVHQLHRRTDAPRRVVGRVHHERHPDLLLEQRGAVIDAAVVAELLAVIGGQHHDDGPPEAGAGLAQQPPERAVHVRDLAVVAVHVGRAVARVLVGLVHVEEVRPEQARRLAVGHHAVDLGERQVRAQLGFEVGVLVAREPERVVLVEAQALALGVEDAEGVEAGGGVARLAERGRQRGLRKRKLEARGLVQVLADHQRAQRVAAVRGRRVGSLEDHGLGRERVDLGAEVAARRVAVGAQVVGPQGVDGDEQDVRLGGGRRRGALVALRPRAPVALGPTGAGHGDGFVAGVTARHREQRLERQHHAARVGGARVHQGDADVLVQLEGEQRGEQRPHGEHQPAGQCAAALWRTQVGQGWEDVLAQEPEPQRREGCLGHRQTRVQVVVEVGQEGLVELRQDSREQRGRPSP
jgi:hypothetical protein